MSDTEHDNSNGSTGHSKHLRARLRAARQAKAWSLERTGAEIGRWLDRDPIPASTISSWEQFARHPSIDNMAAWARVLGMRLIVDLDEGGSKRIPVLVGARAAELARVADLLSDEDLEPVISMLERMAALKRRR